MPKNSGELRRLGSRRRTVGYTLVEVMIAVAVIAVVAAMAIPSFEPDVAAKLESFAQIVASDLRQARDLAVSGNSTYRVTFERTDNRYYLTHVGSNAALNTLPSPLFPNAANTATRTYTDLDDLPQLGADARLAAVEARRSTVTAVTTVEFGPLGATTETADTIVWLTSGPATNALYIGIRVNAVTGLTTIEPMTAAAPSTAASGS